MNEVAEITEVKEETVILDKEAMFDMNIKTLLYYQNRINDMASVATRFIAEARNKYNHFFNLHQPFLREYSMEKLRRDKNGEIKGKNYKTITAGGGVFFRAKPEKIHIDETRLHQLQNFIGEHLPEKAGDLVTMKVVYEVPDKQALVDALEQIAEKRAKEILRSPEEITTGTVAGIKEIYSEFGIEVEEADPFYHCYVGSTKGWTGRDLQNNLSQAINGTFRATQEEEIDLILDDLEA